MNKIILIGRTTKEPEMRYTTTGKAYTKVTIAVDRKYKNKAGEKETDFIPLVIWGKLAETVAQYVGKGKLIGVEGEMQVRQYEVNSETRYMTEVICSEVSFLERMSN